MPPSALRIHRAASSGPPRRRRPAATRPAGPAVQAEAATLVVRDLAARTFIGITGEERAKRQDVLIGLSLDVLTRAGRTDRIGDAVDYKAIKDAVLRYVEGREHRLLEALAQGIADLCLRHAGVQAVEVEVDKPGALRFARSVAVRIRRERAGAGSGRPGRPSAKPAKRNWGHRG